MESGYLAALVLISLFLFGLGYNWLVAWLEEKRYDRGYTAFLVVGGSAVTLAAGALLVGLEPVLWLLVCFAASGLPMVVGSCVRSWKARQRAEIEVIKQAKEMLRYAEATGGWICDATANYPGSERE